MDQKTTKAKFYFRPLEGETGCETRSAKSQTSETWGPTLPSFSPRIKPECSGGDPGLSSRGQRTRSLKSKGGSRGISSGRTNQLTLLSHQDLHMNVCIQSSWAVQSVDPHDNLLWRQPPRCTCQSAYQLSWHLCAGMRHGEFQKRKGKAKWISLQVCSSPAALRSQAYAACVPGIVYGPR